MRFRMQSVAMQPLEKSKFTVLSWLISQDFGFYSSNLSWVSYSNENPKNAFNFQLCISFKQEVGYRNCLTKLENQYLTLREWWRLFLQARQPQRKRCSRTDSYVEGPNNFLSLITFRFLESWTIKMQTQTIKTTEGVDKFDYSEKTQKLYEVIFSYGLNTADMGDIEEKLIRSKQQERERRKKER